MPWSGSAARPGFPNGPCAGISTVIMKRDLKVPKAKSSQFPDFWLSKWEAHHRRPHGKAGDQRRAKLGKWQVKIPLILPFFLATPGHNSPSVYGQQKPALTLLLTSMESSSPDFGFISLLLSWCLGWLKR